MTIEQAIANRERCLEYLLNCKAPATLENVEAVRMSIDALRAMVEEEKNGPLTVDELNDLPVMAWVWIELLAPLEFGNAESAYYQKHSDYTCGEAFCCGYPCKLYNFDYVDYGKTWLAYRTRLMDT